MPSIYSFTFGGLDLYEKYGILIEHVRDTLTPNLRQRKVTVPDRSGAYDYGARYYDERALELSCLSLNNLTRDEMRELAYDLSGKKQLIIYREPEKYYLAQMYDPAQISYAGRVGSRYTLAFSCEPFAFGQQVTEAFSNSGDFSYQGTAETPVRITITNPNDYPLRGITITMREAIV